jgi:DNA repair photolyase
MDLFSSLIEENNPRKTKLGHTSIDYVQASGILTEAKGFMGAYDYTLNPYSGCSFGCNYCYAAFFSRSTLDKDNWGNWLRVKENALQLLIKKRKKPLINKTIYMSSVTDPYQPLEKDLELTRSILVELLTYHKVRLVIQTRSQLVTRDIDLFRQFEVIQINMTITTDSEEVRKAFEPLCPSNKVRLKAIKEIADAGIPTCITMTPLLPVLNIQDFTTDLLMTGVKKFIVQPFHQDKGKFIAGTGAEAIEQFKKLDWSEEKYEEVVNIFRQKLPWLGEGKNGFAPI